MSRAKKFLESAEKVSVANKATRVRSLQQYVVGANTRRPTSKTKPTLEAGVYNIHSDMMGPYFDVHEVNTDELLRFKDSRYNAILEEVKEFWELKPKFQRLGFTNKRGVLMHGKPGTGKSCIIKLMMEDMVERGDVVFLARSVHSLKEGLKQFREVEPERKALVVLEEVDEMLYDLRAISELFDGDDQIGDVLFVGTTNYLERIPPKMLREGRFDRKVEILPPPKEGRLEYLRRKLGILEDVTDAAIEEHADQTDGFTFGQLREFLIGAYVYGKPVDQVIKRIQNGGGLDEAHTDVSDNALRSAFLHHFGCRLDKNGKVVKIGEEEKQSKPQKPINLSEAKTTKSPEKKKKSRAGDFMEQIRQFSRLQTPPVDAESIKQEFDKKLADFGLDGISVTHVEVDYEGDTIIHFEDDEGDEIAILFTVDPEDGAQAVILDDDTSSEEVTMVDLDPLTPVLVNSQFGQYVNLSDLSWMNKSSLVSIFMAGDIGNDDTVDVLRKNVEVDAFGHQLSNPAESKGKSVEIEVDEIREDNEIVEAGFKVVVRGGKRVRLPLVRRRRRRRLTQKQKAGLRKAQLTRRARRQQISKKLKKSLKVRKRLGVKKQKTRGFKVSTAGAGL